MFKEVEIEVQVAEVALEMQTPSVEMNMDSIGGMPVLLKQIQADWGEGDVENVAYIKNKPTKVSAWENDKKYVEESQALTNAEILAILMK